MLLSPLNSKKNYTGIKREITGCIFPKNLGKGSLNYFSIKLYLDLRVHCFNAVLSGIQN